MADDDAGWCVDVQGFVEDRSAIESIIGVGVDDDCRVDLAGAHQFEQLVGRLNEQSQRDVGELVSEAHQHVAEVMDGGGVDHADRELADRSSPDLFGEAVEFA